MELDRFQKMEHFAQFIQTLSGDFGVQVAFEGQGAVPPGTLVLPDLEHLNEQELDFLYALCLREVGQRARSKMKLEDLGDLKTQEELLATITVDAARNERYLVRKYPGGAEMLLEHWSEHAHDPVLGPRAFGFDPRKATKHQTFLTAIKWEVLGRPAKFGWDRLFPKAAWEQAIKVLETSEMKAILDTPMRTFDDAKHHALEALRVFHDFTQTKDRSQALAWGDSMENVKKIKEKIQSETEHRFKQFEQKEQAAKEHLKNKQEEENEKFGPMSDYRDRARHTREQYQMWHKDRSLREKAQTKQEKLNNTLNQIYDRLESRQGKMDQLEQQIQEQFEKVAGLLQKQEDIIEQAQQKKNEALANLDVARQALEDEIQALEEKKAQAESEGKPTDKFDRQMQARQSKIEALNDKESRVEDRFNDQIERANHLEERIQKAIEKHEDLLKKREERDQLMRDLQNNIQDLPPRPQSQSQDNAQETASTPESKFELPKDSKSQQGQQEQNGQSQQSQAQEGQAQEGKAQEGQAQEGQAQEGKAQEGQAQEGQAQEGQSNEGQAQQAQQGRSQQGQGGQSQGDQSEGGYAQGDQSQQGRGQEIQAQQGQFEQGQNDQMQQAQQGQQQGAGAQMASGSMPSSDVESEDASDPAAKPHHLNLTQTVEPAALEKARVRVEQARAQMAETEKAMEAGEETNQEKGGESGPSAHQERLLDRYKRQEQELKEREKEYQEFLKNVKIPKEMTTEERNAAEEQAEKMYEQAREALEVRQEKHKQVNKAREALKDIQKQAHQASFNVLKEAEAALAKQGIEVELMPKAEVIEGWEAATDVQRAFDEQASQELSEHVVNGEGAGRGVRNALVNLEEALKKVNDIDPNEIFEDVARLSPLSGMSESGVRESEANAGNKSKSAGETEVVQKAHTVWSKLFDKVQPVQEKNASVVQALSKTWAKEVEEMKQFFKKYLQPSHKTKFHGGREEGDLDARNIWKMAAKAGDDFFEISRRHPTSKTAAIIVVDVSGSMQTVGDEASEAYIKGMTYLLSQALESVHVPYEVLAVYAPQEPALAGQRIPEVFNRKTCALHTTVIKGFRDKDLSGLAGLHIEQADNSDGESIRVALDRLRRQSAKDKMIFYISDAKPFMHDADPAILDEDLRRAMLDAAKQKVVVYSMGPTEHHPVLGEQHLYVTDPKDLPKVAQQKLNLGKNQDQVMKAALLDQQVKKKRGM